MKISFGTVDGNGWEAYCQKLFRLKYKDDDYQEVPAKFGGDLGIEGFTKSGKAFQCYCPDDEPNSKELYDSQRNKITRDVKKLIKNELKLINILGGTKIKRWYLVTPKYENKSLLAHCKKKAKEIIKKNCKHISNDFDVLLQTEDDYLIERNLLNSNDHLKIDVEIDKLSDTHIQEWINEENKLYRNAFDKISNIPNVKNANEFTERNIKIFLEGQNLLSKFHKDYPSLYESLLKHKNAQEYEIESFSMLESPDKGELLKQCYEDYEHLLKKNLGNRISSVTIKYLTGEAVADWLIRCPLSF